MRWPMLLLFFVGGCSASSNHIFECEYQVATMSYVPGNHFQSLYRISPAVVEEYDDAHGAFVNLCDAGRCSVDIKDDRIAFSTSSEAAESKVRREWVINRNNGAMTGEVISWKRGLGREDRASLSGSCQKSNGPPKKAL